MLRQVREDYSAYLRHYLERTGREIKRIGNADKICCPAHEDKHPSCQVNAETLYCYSCGWSGNIYSVLEIDRGITDYKQKLTVLNEMFGGTPLPVVEQPKSDNTKTTPVAVHPDRAKDLFATAELERVMSQRKDDLGKVVAVWFYRDKRGMVDGVDARFENGKKKSIITFWFNGRTVVAKGAPFLIWNRDRIENEKDKPILIVEGVKSAVAAEQIDGFIPVTWNRGGKSVGKGDWACVEKRDVYIYPDDDLSGRKTADDLHALLPRSVIVEPLLEARKIKKGGADIVEALAVRTPEEMRQYILAAGNRDERRAEKPFAVLGTGDDGKMYALDRDGRLRSYEKSSLGKGQLQTLAPLGYWWGRYSDAGKMSWDMAAEDLLIDAERDFDADAIRGRGAWGEKDGSICYHDGMTTTGERSPSRLYVRKAKKDVGINHIQCPGDEVGRIRDIVKRMTFEHPVDACLMLAWSALSAFGGALPWRPAILITGESGSGKSTVMDRIVRPISQARTFSGGGTTEPGVRQAIGIDSYPVIIEEAEANTPIKKANRDALMSLMRQSTSDDAPEIAKGTAGDQKGVRFTCRSMFCFIGIDPTIQDAADDNRIIRVNMVKADSGQECDFREIERGLIDAVTDDACAGIRARVFAMLPKMIETAKEVQVIIRDVSGRDLRYGFGAGLLWACYWHVWENRESVDIDECESFLKQIYAGKEITPRRNESVALLDDLLDHVILLHGADRQERSIRELLAKIEDDDILELMKMEMREALERMGVKRAPCGGVAIAKDHPRIKKVLGEMDYALILQRHPGCTKKTGKLRFCGDNKPCVIVKLTEDDDWHAPEQQEIPY